MSGRLLDAAVLQSQADSADWLQKELKMRQLQKTFQDGKTEEQKLREAANGFESMFLQKLWQQMRATVPKEGYLHSKQEDQYLAMFDKDMADQLAEAGGMGLGDMLFNHLKESMDKASRVTSPSSVQDKPPLKPLSASYDPRFLQPPDAAEQVPEEGAPAGNKLSMDDLYAPLDGYEDVAQGAAEEPDVAVSMGAEPQLLEEVSLVRATERQEREAPLLLEPAPAIPRSQDDVTRAREEGASIRTDTRVLDEVDALARSIAPHATPVTRERRTLINTSAPVGDRVYGAQEQQLRLLENTIERKQGAVENQGGTELPESGSGRIEGTAAPDATPSGGSPAAPFVWPVDGRLTSDFGLRRSALTGERVFHPGIDLAAEYGEPVKSCWDGTVTFTGKKPGLGNVVIVEHADGWQSVYGHNSDFAVKAGESVKAGQKIASVGSTGQSTGPHVHFEIRQQGTAFDPMKIQNSLVSGRSIGHGA